MAELTPAYVGELRKITESDIERGLQPQEMMISSVHPRDILALLDMLKAAEAELTRCNEFLEVAQEVGQRELSRAEAAEAALRGEMK